MRQHPYIILLIICHVFGFYGCLNAAEGTLSNKGRITGKIIQNGEQAVKIAKAASYFGLGIRSGNYISFISGPSRTGDIGFEIVEGMHGPSEVHVILLDNKGTKLAKGKVNW